MSLQTPLGRVKGLGSARHGVKHWLAQRVTAVALVPLVVWFVLAALCFALNGQGLMPYLQNPFRAVIAMTFVAVSLYHGSLGLQVVIEDYVHCHKGRAILIYTMRFLTLLTMIAGVLAILKLHLNGGA